MSHVESIIKVKLEEKIFTLKFCLFIKSSFLESLFLKNIEKKIYMMQDIIIIKKVLRISHINSKY